VPGSLLSVSTDKASILLQWGSSGGGVEIGGAVYKRAKPTRQAVLGRLWTRRYLCWSLD